MAGRHEERLEMIKQKIARRDEIKDVRKQYKNILAKYARALKSKSYFFCPQYIRQTIASSYSN
jgi:hypothetical protein